MTDLEEKIAKDVNKIEKIKKKGRKQKGSTPTPKK